MAYWLMKSEPATYGWDDLVREGCTWWDGVRNPAARLHLRAMSQGDQAFYHSGAERSVIGIMEIAGEAAPDGPDGAWAKVKVEPLRAIGPVTLKQIKSDSRLAKMELIRQSRLSVSPVRAEEWEAILEMAES